MEPKLREVFQKATYEPEAELASRIWHDIALREKRAVRVKVWIFSFIGFSSLLGLVPAVRILLHDFAQSGFFEYVSLAFSNIPSLTSYWREFAFSLAESLPLVSTMLSLGLVFVFFLSVRYTMKQIIKRQMSLSI